MWELYDRLLEELPEGEQVISGQISPVWTTVRTPLNMGMAMTPPQPYRPISLRGNIMGMELRKLAGYLKSWDFYEAALGLAALNTHCNQRSVYAEDPRIIVSPVGK